MVPKTIAHKSFPNSFQCYMYLLTFGKHNGTLQMWVKVGHVVPNLIHSQSLGGLGSDAVTPTFSESEIVLSPPTHSSGSLDASEPPKNCGP